MENVGIFDGHLVRFVVILVDFSRIGMLCQEKTGNPGMLFLKYEYDGPFKCVSQRT
jgi:hypothetical protein